jgi:hypothetical protein
MKKIIVDKIKAIKLLFIIFNNYTK